MALKVPKWFTRTAQVQSSRQVISALCTLKDVFFCTILLVFLLFNFDFCTGGPRSCLECLGGRTGGGRCPPGCGPKSLRECLFPGRSVPSATAICPPPGGSGSGASLPALAQFQLEAPHHVMEGGGQHQPSPCFCAKPAGGGVAQQLPGCSARRFALRRGQSPGGPGTGWEGRSRCSSNRVALAGNAIPRQTNCERRCVVFEDSPGTPLGYRGR